MKTEITKEEAIRLCKSKWWLKATPEQIVTFQLYTGRLCMDFGDFQDAVEAVLGRSVWSHEFAYPEHLRKEHRGDKPAPTFQEILDQIPHEELILVLGDS